MKNKTIFVTYIYRNRKTFFCIDTQGVYDVNMKFTDIACWPKTLYLYKIWRKMEISKKTYF